MPTSYPEGRTMTDVAVLPSTKAALRRSSPPPIAKPDVGGRSGDQYLVASALLRGVGLQLMSAQDRNVTGGAK